MYAQLLANILVAIGYAMVLAVAVACAVGLVHLRGSDSPRPDGKPADRERSE